MKLNKEEASKILLGAGLDFGVNELYNSALFRRSKYLVKPYVYSAAETDYNIFFTDRLFAINNSTLRNGELIENDQIIQPDWNLEENQKILRTVARENKFTEIVRNLLDNRMKLKRNAEIQKGILQKELQSKSPQQSYQYLKKILKLMQETKSIWNKISNTNDYIAKNAYSVIKSLAIDYAYSLIVIEDSNLRGGKFSKKLNYRIGTTVRGFISMLITNFFNVSSSSDSTYHPAPFSTQRCPSCGEITDHVYLKLNKSGKNFSFVEKISPGGNYIKCSNPDCVMNKMFEIFKKMIDPFNEVYDLLVDKTNFKIKTKFSLHGNGVLLDTESLFIEDIDARLIPLRFLVYFLGRDRAAATNFARGNENEAVFINKVIIGARSIAKLYRLYIQNAQLPVKTEDSVNNSVILINEFLTSADANHWDLDKLNTVWGAKSVLEDYKDYSIYFTAIKDEIKGIFKFYLGLDKSYNEIKAGTETIDTIDEKFREVLKHPRRIIEYSRRS